MKIVIDSYAWIEIFLGTPKGEDARKNLREAENTFTPDVVLAEVARKYACEGIEEGTIRRRVASILQASQPVHVDEMIALEAGRAYQQLERKGREERLRKPNLFDAIVLAVARVNGAKVLTGDRHFKGLPETLWLG